MPTGPDPADARDLETDRPLARNDRGIDEGVDEDRAPLLRERRGRRLGIVVRPLDQTELRAVPADVRLLRLGRGGGDEDDGRNAELAGDERNGLAVVARRGGDETPAAQLGGERCDRVVRAADLERTRALPALSQVDVTLPA